MRKYIGKAMIMLSLFAPLAAQAQPATEISANAGWVSQYYYRGILQTTSSASAGLDVTAGPVYLGSWAADVGDGAEVDFYGGLAIDVGEVSLSSGATAYFYTGEFDDTYLEANLGLGAGPISLEYSIGTYDSPPDGGKSGDQQDYKFFAVTAEHMGFYGTLGTFSEDFEGRYGEVGYGFSAGDMDFTISGIKNDKYLSVPERSPTSGGHTTLVFGVSKTFVN